MGGAGRWTGLGALALLAGCASKPAAPPEPAPAPVAAPPAPAPAPMPPLVPDWRDIALTPGEWRYQDEGAFGAAEYAGGEGSLFVMRCERSARQVVLSRPGAAPLSGMTIRTESTVRSFPAASAGLAASDPFLDAMVFSRGRFVVETLGRMLVLPAWPEPARVVEDCRS